MAIDDSQKREYNTIAGREREGKESNSGGGTLERRGDRRREILGNVGLNKPKMVAPTGRGHDT
jgi:hypothetical protein